MTAPAPSLNDRYIVPGLKRGLDLLRQFSRDSRTLGVGELARRLDLPRTTVFRLARTLEAMGFLQRVDETRSYRLGPAVLGLGFEYLASLDLPEIAGPALEALRDVTGASAHLAILDGTEIVYLARFPSRGALSSNIRVGSRLPAHATSMGRILLAELDDAALAGLYRGRSLDAFTGQTPTDMAALRSVLHADRARGYAPSRSFYERGVVSIAAVLRDLDGRAVAAINVTGSEQAIDVAALEGPIKDAVCHAAQTISTWLGHRDAGARARVAV
jgi:DNA-binding IclR family transcriptional regulator